MRIPRFVLAVLSCAAFFGASSGVTYANDDEMRSYSDGKLTKDDFKMEPPNPLKKDNGVELKAEIKTFIRLAVPASDIELKGKEGVEVTATPKKISTDSGVNRSKSYNTEKENKEVLDHEQGHLDLAEIQRRKLQAELNKMIKNKKLVGTGKTVKEAEEDLGKKIQEVVDKHTKELDDADKAYDSPEKTNHGLNKEEQKKEREKQKNALEDPNKNKLHKTGPEVKSHAEDSISFNADTSLLAIENDFITELLSTGSPFSPDTNDPILGAELKFSEFLLVGDTSGNEIFFSAVGNGFLRVTTDDTTLFDADLDYLLYDRGLNSFFGLTSGFSALEGESTFIDAIVSVGTSGSPALFGIELFPNEDFFAVTNGFTESGSAPVDNLAGQRRLVSEPSSIVLFGIGYVALLGYSWRKRNAA
ncbi:PEP-CTERM sorting domain-containing protein [Nitrosomonas sp.]|uniref:PEP-CTERM sorting domain-containing protein n=1 Tax=Nitrosomonas sp. TaxID=42353 RepID=UPI00207E7F8B|nr:PEP-CTERM sorting domain-containing protein [Nitrosomonas sp.]GJL76983.1 MAG: hypothetical protein NMNS02_30890 [Nitrosomonas sp.]